jgi:hypothetical protein
MRADGRQILREYAARNVARGREQRQNEERKQFIHYSRRLACCARED